MLVTLAAGALPCWAQYPEDYHPYSLEAGGGEAWVMGADKANFEKLTVFQAGGSIALPGWGAKPPRRYNHDISKPMYRRWNVFARAELLYGRAGIGEEAVQQIIESNPQTPSLLSATGGEAKFYSATLGPRVQYSRERFNLYFQAGFGWFKRSIGLTGVATEGSVLQPNNQSVFGQGGTPGGAGGGVGADCEIPRLRGVRIFGEFGLLQGLAINHSTRLAPLSFGLRW